MAMKEKFSQDKKIDLACSALAHSIMNAFDKKSKHYAWPMPVITSVDKIAFVYYEFLAARVFFYLEELEKQGNSKSEIAKLIKYPSIVARILHFPLAKDFTGLSQKQLMGLVERVYDLVSLLQEDPFCFKTHKNLLKESNDLKKIEDNWIVLKDSEMEDEIRRTLGKIKGTLFNYTELLYSIFHNAGHEFHGPYPASAKESLLISNYHDLNPGFWPVAKEFPLNNITIFEVYTKNNKIEMDLHNRVYSKTSSSKIASKILFVTTGHKIVSNFNQLKKVEKLLEKNIYRMTEYISTLSKEELVLKYGEAMFYMFKPFSDKLGINWSPPSKFYEKIREPRMTKEEIDYIELTSTMPLKHDYVKKCFDPRVTKAGLFEAIKF